MRSFYVRLSFVVALMVCPGSILAQTALLKDSAYRSIQNIKNDSVRTERSLQYLSKLAVGKSPIAADYEDLLLSIARKQKDSLAVGRIHSSLGYSYLSIGEFDQAYKQYYAAMPLIQTYGKPRQMVRIYEDMGWIQIQLKDYQKAEASLSNALQLCEKYKLNDKTGEIYGFYGILYDSQLKFDQAITNYKKALDLNKRYGTKFSVVSALINMAISQRRLKKFPEALNSLFQAKATSDSLNNGYYKQAILQNIGEVAYDNKDYKTAETYILQALQNSKNNTEPVLRKGLLGLLKSIYAKKGDYKTALQYADSLQKINEGIFAKEKMALTSDIETKYQTALKDDKLAKQELMAAQQQQEIESKKHMLELVNKENEIARLDLSHKQAQLQNEQIKQAAFKEKEALLFKLNNEAKNKQIGQQQQQISSNKTFRALMIIVLGFVALLSILMYYNYNKTKWLSGIISAQKKDLEITGQVKDRLFSVVSHDMRAPINTLIAFTQLLEYGDISPENMQKYASELKRSLNHTSVLMENLLNWASSQMQGFKPQVQVFDVSLIAGELLATLKEHAARKHITLDNHIASGTLVLADINMLQLVIRNLMSNAIKFTNDEGVVILNAETVGPNVSITIKDSGVGMSQKDVDQFNADDYSKFAESNLGTNNEKGTGLGLMLCKNFALLMNGAIKVESKEKTGSTFLLSLPTGVALS